MALSDFLSLHPLTAYAAAIAGLLVLILALSAMTGTRRVGPARGRSMNLPFESGILPVGSAQLRLPIQYYLIAMFFVIFDVESVFLFSWAPVATEAGWRGYGAIVVFIFFLAAALAYLWRGGGLDWGPTPRVRPDRG
ncbi:NAD(P)H-quinone oxidoreductase subunit 3 [Gluconacetobacter azotocaptans]|uniref:NADH-quinone oxidoreductase subunit A n=1 Tax=Gluconacetobacter azotocaptans TaxID=142834 RepID=A0A7W4PC70_9PROT|nr:NADH-quinone oxidoreductase subunit A [Gluconacetobacter azotocaptans]MBB2188907.1 NAD(P)H-quinone oxidoreductase subunit 3 [Gluconacetobacter azotocaptans]MBM9401521.1 NADH-quinone oxidoreductase subunit A [Gluconacetobacter azotocaptans]GBQ26042.1 NADH-quinone oxidoreductase subunit A [Gluconacetobacter azotocaptans DSM 13594]